jgi:membrane protein
VLGGLIPIDIVLLGVITNVAAGLLPVAVVGIALALLFRRLPRARVDRRAAVIGGGVTAVGMTAAVYLVAAYLRRFGISSARGAAGSVFVVLTAIYVQSQIVLAGAELTKVLTRRWEDDLGPIPR